PDMWKTGHSFIKARLKETGAHLGGEMSGHIFFKERWFGFDDALYTAARLLEILSADDRSVSEIFAEIPNSINTPELNVQFAEGEHHRFIEKFVASAQFDGATLTTIDGLRADFEDGWGLVRASNTTPSLVIRFEADTEEALARIQQSFGEAMHAVDSSLSLPF
ncbi:MAG TPA: phosphomannomutase/phosphoglucomutase, partial [Gammaproteobacteria bacterium]|nr:phosphomannomutase/phosphoglucomutase [Gammaproteobacteria bacterium]